MKFFLLLITVSILFNFIYCTTDKVCDSQNVSIENAFKKENPITKFVFTNDSKTSVHVTWAGDNSGKIILVTTKEIRMFMTFVDLSDIYFSDNNGKTFTRITEKLPIKNVIVRKDNGLQRNTRNNHNIFLVCYDTNERSQLLITEDGGETWKKAELDFILNQNIEFHPTEKSWFLTANKAGDLYKSKDGGYTWKHVLSNVQQYQWSTNKSTPEAIIAKVGRVTELSLFERFFGIKFQKPMPLKLQISNDFGETWKTIKEQIYGFILRDKFLYVSEMLLGGRRRLLVSTDSGLTFNKVYLPTIYSNQFYSILDIEEDLVYIHVDNPGARGDGILFTSDTNGQIFSQSLMNHFFPSPETNSDFYKVKSMRGTYIASQLKPDHSIQSVITFNRGAEWQYLRKPENSICHDQTKTDCHIQVTGTYSVTHDVASFLPVSSSTAVGLVIVHAHLANSLKNSKSDVYISSDGGYNWNKTLDGPHECVIADHGGLLVALGENKQIVKFSTDEGRCWHEHQYTTDDIEVTGLLTEPGNKAMTVLIWGYSKSTKQWVIHVLDLSQLLNRECNSADYEKWYAHSEMMHPLGDQYFGCLLGKKEIFLRLKKDSLCKNGYSHEVHKNEEICPCTEDDFECEYGYYRKIDSKTCIRNELIKENICVEGVVEKIITQGYKKIPGDICTGGFAPDKTKQKMLNQTCQEDEKLINIEESNQNVKKKNDDTTSSIDKQKSGRLTALKQVSVKSSYNKILAISICSGLLALFVIFLGFIVTSRRRIIKARTSNLKYKVLAGLSGRDINKDGDDEALLTNETGYESTSPTKNSKKGKTVPDDSDVDMIG